MHTGTKVVRWIRDRRAVVSGSVALALTFSVMMPTAQATVGKAGGLGRPQVQEQRDSDVHAVTGLGAKKERERLARARLADEKRETAARAEQHVSWPQAGHATADLTASGTGRMSVAAGGLPVRVTPAAGGADAVAVDRAEVRVLDRETTAAAGMRGVLLTVSAAEPGRAKVAVNYASFASAYGGGWSGRLRLVRLPDCALTTPQKAQCRDETPLATHNDIKGRSVSATTELGVSPVVLAVTAAAGGESASGSGTYSATALSPSSTWEAGGSSGSFTWSYPLGAPPAAAGPAPSMSLSYDSGSIDGRTASTNNQATQVGEGFDISSSSYVERSYGSCDDDGPKDKFDLCWKYENASLVLNGKRPRG